MRRGSGCPRPSFFFSVRNWGRGAARGAGRRRGPYRTVRWRPAGQVGTYCALLWQFQRRLYLDGVEPKPARVFSLVQGNVCLEPVPYLQDLKALPESLFTRFYGVRELHFGATQIYITSSDITHIDRHPGLEYLELTNHKVERLPDGFCDLKDMFMLLLRNNVLVELPNCIGKMASLKHLDVAMNFLEALPDGITKLPLHLLHLGQNQISRLPDSDSSVNPWPDLNEFNVDYNGLDCLPAWFEDLSKVTVVQAMFNGFTGICGTNQNRAIDASKLAKLRRLVLINNDLKKAPANLASGSPDLEVLRLDLNGDIDALPVELATMPKLKFVGLFATKLCDGFTVKQEMLDDAFIPLINTTCPVISCCEPDALGHLCWPQDCV